jgi:adhesin/invasin
MASKRNLRPGSRPASAGHALLRDETGTIRRRVLLGLVVVLTAAAGALVYAKLAHAAVTVTPANASATADTAQTAGNTWTNLGNIAITENSNADFATGTGVTVVLNVPSGWRFQAGTGSVTSAGSAPSSANIGNLTFNIAAGAVTATFDVGNTNKTDTLTFSGLKVQPTAGTPLQSGNITKSGTAAIAGVSGATNFGTLTETGGAATQLNVTAASTTPTAGATDQLTVSALDQFGNTAPLYAAAHNITFGGANSINGNTPTVTNNAAAAINFGTATALTFTAGVSTVGGVATFYKAETASITATDGSFSDASPLSVTVGSAAANTIASNGGSGQSATVNTNVGTVPSAIVKDQYTNPVSGTSVTFAVTGGGGSVVGGATTTNTSGIASPTSWKMGTTAGANNNTMTATSAGLGGSPVTFTDSATAGAANKLIVTTQPAGATAGANLTTQPVVKIEDQFNNVVTSDSSTVTVNLQAGSGSLQGTLSKAAVNGVATFTNLRSDNAADAKTLRFTDGALTLADANSFTVSPGALASFSFSLAGPQTNGVPFTGTNTLTALDAFGNVVTGFNAFGDNVTIAANGALSTGSVSGLSGVNELTANADFLNGVANLTTLGLTYTGVTGSGTFTATSASGKTGTSGSITVNLGSATHLGLTGTPASVTAGNTGSVTVTALDASNNTATGYTGTAHFTSSDGQAVLPGNYTFVGGDNGTHTFSSAYTLKTAASQTVTATDTVTGSINGTSAGITVNPAAASTLSVTAGAAQTAGTSFTTTVTAKDAFGNTATGYTGTVHFTSNDGQALLPANYTFLAGDVGTKNVTVTLKSAGSRSMVATDTVASSITGSRSVTVNPANADGGVSTVAASPTSVTADDSTTSTVTATLTDAFGNPIAGKSISLARVGSGSSTIAGSPTTTDAAGVAQFTVKDAVAESQTFRATDTTDSLTLTQTAGVAFTPGTASLNTSTFTGGPASIVANGSSTSTVTLHLSDALGNDLSAPDGSTIAFTTDLGSVGPATDNGDGTYTATLTSGTVAGTATVSATRNGFAFTQSFTVTLTLGPVSAGVSTASASPSSVLANGSAISTVTVTLKDANGNVVTGKTVSLGQGGGSSTIAPASAVTSSSGVATFTVKSTVAESVTYTATDTTDSIAVTQQPGVTFTPGAVTAAQSTVAASLGSVVADNAATSTITVTLKDADGNVVAGKTVALGQGAGSSTISPASTVTDGSGQAVFTVENPVAESVVYTATDTTDSVTVTQTASVNFVPGAASLTNSTITAAPTSIAADGSSTSTVTVRLEDALNNDLTGSAGIVALSTTRGTLSSVTDHGDGAYTATLTSSTVAGTATVSGTLNGSGFAASAAVDTVAGPVTHFAVAAGSPQTAGTAFNVTVTAQDANGNTVTGYTGTVHFTSTDATAVLPADYAFVAGDSGAHVFSATLKTAGPQTVTATQGSNTGTTSAITVAPAGVSSAASTVSASPSNVTADGTQSTVTVTLKDQFGNTVPGVSVNLVAGGGSSSIQATPLTTDGSGAAAFRVSDLVAEQVTYGAASVTQTATVTFDPGALHHLTITPTSSSIVAGNSQTYVVRSYDTNNNLIANVSGSAGLGILPAPGGTSCTAPSCTSNTVGSYTVIASFGGKTASATLTVDPAAASLAQSAITTDDGSLQVGPSHTTLVHVTLKDQFGNPVGATGGPVNLSTTSGSLSSVTDNLDGTYTATLTAGTATGVASVTGNLGGPANPFASSASLTFTPGPATHLTLSPSATNVVAGNAFTVDVSALDQYDNLDTDYAHTVHFTSTDGSASLPADTTLPSGAKTVPVTLNSAGSRTITATDLTAGAVNGATPAITVAAGGVSAAQSTISASPSSVVHDGSTSSTITVTLKDGSGNPVAGKAVTLDQGSGSSSITTVSGTTDLSGQATFTVTDMTVEPVTYTATGDGVQVTPTAVVNFTNGALDHIVLTPAGATISAGAVQAYHVEGYDSSNVDLGDLTGSSTLELDGVTCGGSSCSSTAAGTHTITATNSGKSDTATLTVTAASASTATSIVSTPASTTVSNPGGGVTVTVSLKDAFGNPLASGGEPVTIQSSLGVVGSITDHNDGTYTAPLSSTTTGVASVTAKIGPSTVASSSTVTFGPDSAAQLALTAPVSTTAGNPITVDATLRDQFGNIATGYTGTVTFTSNDGQATLPAAYTFTGTDAGTRSFSVTLKTAGSTLTVGAADGPIGGTTPNITVSPAGVSGTTSTLTASTPPGGVPADGTSTATVTATLEDQYGNALQGKSVQILPGGSSVPSSSFATTNASGQVTFTLADGTVEDVTLSALDVTDGLGLSGPAVSFVAGGAESIVVSPGTQTIQAGAGQTYTVKAYDHWNHYLGNVATSSAITVDGTPCPSAVCSPTSVGSHSVQVDYLGLSGLSPYNLSVSHGPLTGITVSGPGGTVGIGTNAAFTSTGHDAYGNSWNDNGTTTFGITPDGSCSGNSCQPAVAGDHTVTGTDGSFSDSTTLHVTNSGIGAGVVDPSQSTIAASSGTVAPDGTTATITVTLRDGTGAAVSGKTVTLHTGPAAKVGDGDSHPTNGLGQATFTVSDTTATPPETITYSADDTTDSLSLSSTASISYTTGGGSGPGPVDAGHSSIVAAPASVAADGTATTTITVALADASGVALSGKDVTVTGGSAAISPHVLTGPGGTATFTATDLTPEPVTFTTTVDGVTLSSNTVTFTAPAAADNTPPNAVPPATASDGGTTITISFDEPLGGSVSGSDFTVVGTAGGNDPVNGASVTPGGTTVTVTVDNPLDTIDTYDVTYNSATLTDEATTPNPAGPFTLQVTVGSGSAPPSGGDSTPPPPVYRAPAPPPPAAVFGGVTPGDGQRLFFLDQIILRATTAAHWSNVTVTPDGGAAQSFPDSDTAIYTIPYTPSAAGGYTIHATMTDPRYDAFTPVDVSSHFDFGPPPPPPPPPTTGNGNAGPSQPGAIDTADGSAHVDWDGSTFSDPVTVNVRPVADGVGASNGGRAIEVTALRTSDNSPVHSLAGVLDIHFANAPADAIPATSEDNAVWSPLPALTSHALPDGVGAAFFRDDSGTVHVLTTHLTYFGLLRAPASKLAFRVVGSVRYVLGKQTTVAARLQSTRTAKITAALFSPHGKQLTTWKLQIKAGTSLVKLRWPGKVKALGTYTITFAAASGGQVAARAIHVQVVGPDAKRPKGPGSVVISGPSVSGLGSGLTGVHVLQTAGDDTFAAAGTPNVSVVVIDVDQYGLGTLRDLHTLFPDIRLIAVSDNPKTLGRAVVLGATVALPSTTPSQQLVALIGRLALQAH